MSFEASSVLSAILVNIPALDSVMVTLIGNGLGTKYVTGSVRAGYTSFFKKEWGGTYTRVTRKVASIGLGASRKLATTTGGLAATLTNTLSIDKIKLTISSKWSRISRYFFVTLINHDQSFRVNRDFHD
jgi:hypothetical protein